MMQTRVLEATAGPVLVRCRRVLAVVVTSVLCLVGLGATPAAVAATSAEPASSLLLTLVARSCPQYTDVTANRARNNIQESLRDLGVDTLYSAGEPIDPVKEAAGQPACTPIPGWTFTLGSGITSGNPQNLSTVTGVNGSATTAASTPALDRYGQPTGQHLAGAVTMTLTGTQASLAQQANRLWVQGGTPSDQLNDARFHGRYGFAALRCAIDNLNGDNVEWISYPQGTRHVFCYAYYVTPPPASATIVVRKNVVDAGGAALPLPAATSFAFQGNVSYNDQPYQGAFTVDVAAAASTGATTFVRGQTDSATGGTPWQLAELDPAPLGFVFVALSCQSALGTSVTTVNAATRAVSIDRLTAGDTVTCTYVDRPQRTGDLELVKVTRGGAGGPFGWSITPPGQAALGYSVTTTAPGVPHLVASAPTGGPLGTYRAVETLPAATAAGSWSFTAVHCLGATPAVDLATHAFTVDIATDGQGVFCVAENTFTPTARISLHKVTRGGTGTFRFAVSRVDPPSGEPDSALQQTATTTVQGIPVTATGDPLDGLPLGTYQVYEFAEPSAQTPTGAWTLTHLDCGPIQGGAGTEVTLTAAAPDVSCTFTDSLQPYGTLTVTKVLAGDGSRTFDVVITTVCRDGQKFTLTVAPDVAGPVTESAPKGFFGPTVCVIRETSTGASSGVSTTWSLRQGASVSTGTGTTVTVVPALGRSVQVVLTDTYAGGSGDGSGLPDTGGGAVTGYLWLAGLLLATGIALVGRARKSD
jgi:hypothetical protein